MSDISDIIDNMPRLTAGVKWLMVEVKQLTADNARLTTERNEAQAKVEQLKTVNARLTTQRDEALDEVTRLRVVVNGEKNIAGTWSLLSKRMQQDHDFAWSVHCNFACPFMDEGVSHESANRAASRIMQSFFNFDVERLKEWKAFPWASKRDDAEDAITVLTKPRHEALDEIDRLTDAGNHSALLNGSRPSDEDIWRQAFFRASLKISTLKQQTEQADEALAEYRKRWPR